MNPYEEQPLDELSHTLNSLVQFCSSITDKQQSSLLKEKLSKIENLQIMKSRLSIKQIGQDSNILKQAIQSKLQK